MFRLLKRSPAITRRVEQLIEDKEFALLYEQLESLAHASEVSRLATQLALLRSWQKDHTARVLALAPQEKEL